MTEQEGNGKIQYTVRELLAEIKLSLAIIETKLDNKAEKAMVDNIERRLTTFEAERATQVNYGNQLLIEFRELQKGYHSNREAITVLETSKKDKEAFNVLWIPIFLNVILTVGAIISRLI